MVSEPPSTSPTARSSHHTILPSVIFECCLQFNHTTRRPISILRDPCGSCCIAPYVPFPRILLRIPSIASCICGSSCTCVEDSSPIRPTDPSTPVVSFLTSSASHRSRHIGREDGRHRLLPPTLSPFQHLLCPLFLFPCPPSHPITAIATTVFGPCPMSHQRPHKDQGVEDV